MTLALTLALALAYSYTACALHVHQVLNNAVTEPGRPALTRDALAARLAAGHRFCIINCWRNVGTDEVCAWHGWHVHHTTHRRFTLRDVMHHATHCESQVRRAPLALYAARYGGGSGSGGGHGGESGAGGGAGGGGGITQQQQAPQQQPLASCFPEYTPDRARSRWYSFPAMRPDELLLFTQYGAIRITLTTAVLTMSPRRKLGHTMYLPCMCIYRPQARSAVGAVALRAARAGRGGRGG